MDNLPMDAPRPRNCHIVKRPDFQGYGFNLHAEKARPGQFIGKVDENSPAEDAGLREGDRIIEVNGVNISQENHKQVVQRIKAISNETSLLVVDKSTDEYYKKQGIVVTSSLSSVLNSSSEVGKTNIIGYSLPQIHQEEVQEEIDAGVVVDNHEHHHKEALHQEASPRSSSSSENDTKVKNTLSQASLFETFVGCRRSRVAAVIKYHISSHVHE